MTTDKLVKHLIVGLLLCSSYSAEAQFSNLQPEASVKMNTGIPVRYTYDPQSTRLRDADSIAGALIISSGNGFESMDLKMVRTGKTWETEFRLPDSAAAVALRFRDGEIIDDNHGNGYIFPVFDRQTLKPGGLAAAAGMMIRCKRTLSLGSAYAQQALELYEKEFSIHPGLRAEKLLDYYTAVAYAKKRPAFPLIEKKADSLLKIRFSEKNWTLAADLLMLTGKRAESDSLKEVIASHSPVKNRMGGRFWSRFLSLESADSMLVILQQERAQRAANDKKELDFMTAVTLSEFAKQGNPGKAWQYLEWMNDSDLRPGVFHQVAKAFIDSGKRLFDADSLLKMALHMPLPASEKGSYLPPADRREAYYKNQSEICDTYARLKNLQGKHKEAVEMQELAVRYAGGANTLFNETLTAYLHKAGYRDELIKQASAFIAAGTGGPGMIKLLGEALPDQAAFPAYLDSLQAIARYRIRRQLEFDMIKRSVPAFSLRKMDSSLVTLESLKGKVVVLDFWATWCVPCKRSFPAMQQAMDLYRNDTSVVFLFVDTWESLPPAKRVAEISKFLDANGFKFQVLLDEPAGSNSRTYKLASALGVEGIPTKFILDRNGEIRFMSVGFTGDALRMVTELSNMISIAMKQ